MTEQVHMPTELLEYHLTRLDHSEGFREIVKAELAKAKHGKLFPIPDPPPVANIKHDTKADPRPAPPTSPLPEGDEQTLASQGFPAHQTAQAIITRASSDGRESCQ